PVLRIWGTGTAAIESVAIRNGLDTIDTVRSSDALGRRVRVVWSGAEVRGRDRMTAWHGRLVIRGNRILDVSPINQWNPESPMERIRDDGLQWRSITTGGLCGAILTLEAGDTGTIEMETAQGALACDLSSLGIEPRRWPFGGLNKQIEISRLPDESGNCGFDIQLALDQLHVGDNPIYVRVGQEDGHMAWTSPLYIVIPD
ncbi:DUF3604 domain-containing protein, partial [Candidatus Bipolaricaulota bacterium]|nr:DUF3604 domain-containing protein [Candidatus Bipolaricaulota bacterium]